VAHRSNSRQSKKVLASRNLCCSLFSSRDSSASLAGSSKDCLVLELGGVSSSVSETSSWSERGNELRSSAALEKSVLVHGSFLFVAEVVIPFRRVVETSVYAALDSFLQVVLEMCNLGGIKACHDGFSSFQCTRWRN